MYPKDVHVLEMLHDMFYREGLSREQWERQKTVFNLAPNPDKEENKDAEVYAIAHYDENGVLSWEKPLPNGESQK